MCVSITGAFTRSSAFTSNPGCSAPLVAAATAAVVRNSRRFIIWSLPCFASLMPVVHRPVATLLASRLYFFIIETAQQAQCRIHQQFAGAFAAAGRQDFVVSLRIGNAIGNVSDRAIRQFGNHGLAERRALFNFQS